MTVLVAADLDRTLIYSSGALALGDDEPPPLTAVEIHEGRAAAFMTTTAAERLHALAEVATVVPVTTRTEEQLRRVSLPGQSRFAVAANGGLLLVDDRADAGWAAQVRRALESVASLEEVWAHVGAQCAPAWTIKLRQASELFCYAVVDRAELPDDFLATTSAWAAGRGWTTSLQGRKLYWVPSPLTKSAAVAEIARRIGADLVLAAGDSLLDIDLLEYAERAIHPAHGELADSGWSSPGVARTNAVGVRAGEEICGWFTDQVSGRQRA